MCEAQRCCAASHGSIPRNGNDAEPHDCDASSRQCARADGRSEKFESAKTAKFGRRKGFESILSQPEFGYTQAGAGNEYVTGRNGRRQECVTGGEPLSGCAAEERSP